MKVTIGIASIGYMKKAVAKVVESQEFDADFVFEDAIGGIIDEDALPESLAKCDALLSSGRLFSALRKISDIPVIEIRPSVFDILRTYSMALAHDVKPFVFLPRDSFAFNEEDVKNVISVPVPIVYYDRFTEIDGIIARYKARGFDCAIGSGLVCERAEKAGMDGVFTYPQESLKTFVRTAYDTAVSIRQKTDLSKKLEIIFKNSKQGIIFTDSDGFIQVHNERAVKILEGLADGLTGTNISAFIPDSVMNTVFVKQTPRDNVICSFGNGKYMVSLIPIMVKGGLGNVMVTLESIVRIQRQEQYIRRNLAMKGFIARHRFDDYDCKSGPALAMIDTAKKFAKSEDSVVILGETGTGKELLAQSIHNHSGRAKNAFVGINCSAISESLLESELFGYDEGAFTGAKKGGKQGYFEMAHKGTLFLDEIAEISYSLQGKLLRAIQERQLIHVGGSTIIDFDVRIIAATNRDLWQEVLSGKFREDLYYRLAVLEIQIPPLREREDDSLVLFFDFVEAIDSIFCSKLKAHKAELSALLRSYGWPGNIRELENFAKSTMAVYDVKGGAEKYLALLEAELGKRKKRSASARGAKRQASADGPAQTESAEGAKDGAAKEAVDETAKGDGADEAHSAQNVRDAAKSDDAATPPQEESGTGSKYGRIKDALLRTRYNYQKAADMLGVSRTTLWRWIKAYEKSDGVEL